MKLSIHCFVLVSLFVSRASAVIGYQYANSACTGNAIQGLSVPDGICIVGTSKAQCNGNQVTLQTYSGSGCTGNVTSQTATTDNCTNSTKYYCSGSLNTPSNALVTQEWNGASCSGPLAYVWEALNTCIPTTDGSIASSNLTFNKTSNSVVTTNYSTLDCTGSGDESSNSLITVSEYYTSSSFSLSARPYYYFYSDTTGCTGNPYQGAAVASGQCVNGNFKYQCVDNALVVFNYPSQGCTGTPSTSNSTVNTCLGGTTAVCSGSFSIPSSSQILAEYSGNSCGDPSYLLFTLTNVCVPNGSGTSKMLVYDQGSNSVVENDYGNTNCTGSPVSTKSTSPVSASFSISSSIVTATVSSFSFAFTTLIVSLYMLWF